MFSIGLPLLLLTVFLGRQFIDLNDIGLSNGFSHPLTGWDHLVTMLAVGIWAAQLRGRAVWMLPLAFVGVMSLGGLAGASGLVIPNVDGVILLSCAVFSVLITRNMRFSSKINVLIVAFFAFFHGFAHGQEISTSASLISYTLGFIFATLLLHGAGILAAKLVVLAITCLLTVLFSSSALAKTAESDIDSKVKNPVINQYRDIDQSKYFWLAPQSRVYEADSPDFNGYCSIAYLSAGQDAGGSGQLAGAGKFSAPPSAMSNSKIKSQLEKHNAGGNYHAVIVKDYLLHVSDKSINRFFYPNYCADCSNLDFKNYYPAINHTPGKHLLSNGVGLTSPPNPYSSLVAPAQFQNPSFNLIATLRQQLNIAEFRPGYSVSKALYLYNANFLRRIISIAGQEFIPCICGVPGFNLSEAVQFSDAMNSFAAGKFANRHDLSANPNIPPLKELAGAELNFFVLKHKSKQLENLIKIIS
ncbi:MAG: HupE/UreJ family protein [Methylomonas sp.]